MFVHYYMTPEPFTIHQELSVMDTFDILSEHHFRHLPVVDDEGVLQGMVTDRDIRSACPSTILKGEERQKILDQVSATPVSGIMSKDFISLQVISTIDDALIRFTSRSVGALPVVDSQNRVVGIFSLNDMMAAYRNLFGLGEKGTMLVSVKDSGEPGLLNKLIKALEEEGIDLTRLVRSSGSKGREPAAIYLRVNTYNLSSVHRVVERAGFTVQIPGWNKQEENITNAG